MKTIIIVEKNAFTRRGLSSMVHDRGKFQVLDFDRPQPAFTAAKGASLFIIDPYQLGSEGSWALRKMHQEHKEVPVLAISSSTDKNAGVKSYRFGANGFLPKSCTPAEFNSALDAIFTSGKYMPLAAAEQIIDYLHGERLLAKKGLSAREEETLYHIGNGKLVGEIAKELSLCVKTISTYRTRLLVKLNLKNNSDLIRYAINEGLTK